MTDPHVASRRWLYVLAMTATALIVGVVAATGALLLAGYRYLPERTFEVTVQLGPDVTDAQKAAIRSELEDLPGELRFETRAEALSRFREQWKNDPERVAGVQVESMSESFLLTTDGREFDCAPIPAIRRFEGVERLWVVAHATGSRPALEIGC